MKLYEINNEIMLLLNQLEPDPETGEVPSDEQERAIIDQINALAMRREDILSYLAKEALNAKAEAAALKEEEKRLHERRQRMERRQEKLIDILDRECGGQKTSLGVSTLIDRHSTRVEIIDKRVALFWLKENGHDDCYHQPEPEIYKSSVGRLLDAGEHVLGVSRVPHVTCYLK